MNYEKISHALEHQKALLDSCLEQQASVLTEISGQLVACFHRGGRLFLAGTGPFGSIAGLIGQTFIHRQTIERPALPAMALSNDPGLATFLSADNKSNQFFSKQLRAIATAEDMLIIFAGTNIDAVSQEAMNVAQQLGCRTILIAGENIELHGALPDFSIAIPTNTEPRLLESSLCIGNLLCSLVESALFGI